jgi:predicted AAA+ superfamily ATPase
MTETVHFSKPIKGNSMKRDIYKSLLRWKTSLRRKPLLLKGARQTGKTYILRKFGANEYNSCFYFNFEKDPLLKDFFSQQLQPEQLIQNLALYTHKTIHPERDLIIFDEIQASNNALKSLKYFQEEAPEYHLAAAGSLLGIALSGSGSFPVGKVNFLELYPMTFLEFLNAIEARDLREYLEKTSKPTPFPKPLHLKLIQYLRIYYFTGGMPEAVAYYAERKDLNEVREIQNEIINAYALDFVRYAASPDIPKLSLIWDSIPVQLAKENKKFVFTMLKKSARLRDFENAIEWLEKSGLILRVFQVKTAKHPLKAYVEEKIFKIYVLDVGLLGAMTRIEPDIIIRGDRIFREYEGAFVENYVAQQLKAAKAIDLYYWQSSGTAEVDFICEYSGHILPLEAKAGINPRSKSLKSFDQKFNPPILSRTTLLNLKKDNRFINIPLYALLLFPELLASTKEFSLS